ncbi:hypothetical protein DFH09DRAFT_1318929 [Mycena vulgaris]|nr:hypothetical protein DFH09DRAFT_1318929 [Mycena vulgaris]
MFNVASIRVIYFDTYGTLIEKEAGVYDALQPLLQRSTYNFSRRETLSFFESEIEMKRRNPGVRYGQILANTYEDFALRHGMTPAIFGIVKTSVGGWTPVAVEGT